MANQEDCLIKKITLSAGTKAVQFKNGTKVKFHYETRRIDNDIVLDDSRKINNGSPMELVLGKKFKLEVWEVIVQKMAINEVAKFLVDKSLLSQYPFVARTLREVGRPSDERRKHCCAMTLQNEGIGYPDLNNLLQNPTDLQFTIELLSAESPEDYVRDSWQLSEDEKLLSVTDLKNRGNALYKEKKLKEAADQYAKAIGILEQLMLKEKPRDTEWFELRDMKMPLLLNYSQCMLGLKDYYPVIQHCTEVLEADPDNVKALFRRARASLEVWDPEASRADFIKSASIDPSLHSTVKKYLQQISKLQKQKDEEDKQKLQNLF